MKIVGVLLCGGAARRFGADKLLAGEPPIVVQAARNLRLAEIPCLAVVPLGATALRELLEGAGLEILATDRTQRGMGGSLAAAIEASAGAEGWIVALGDMPAVRGDTVIALRNALESGSKLAAPFDAAGRRGHPVAFSEDLREELLSLDWDRGARDVLAAHEQAVHRIVTDDPGIFLDIDTPADLARLAARNR